MYILAILYTSTVFRQHQIEQLFEYRGLMIVSKYLVLFIALTPDCMHWVFLLVSIQTVFKINTIIYRNKLFTDEFHCFEMNHKMYRDCVYIPVHAVRCQRDKKNWGLYVPYMAPYLMNHYLRKYLIKIWCVLF
jgi:hypothetical protein